MAGTRKTPARRTAKKADKISVSDRRFWLPILLAVAVLALFAASIFLIPKLLSTQITPVAPADPYAAFRPIYTEVTNFNFAHGGDVNLERKVIAALDRGRGDTAGYYFHVMAAAEYYYGVQNYDLALAFAEEAEYLAPSDNEYEDVLKFFIKYYHRIGDTENEELFQKTYDDFVYEPENCGDSEEATE